MKKSLFIPLIAFLLFASISFAVDTQVYPPEGSSIPYGAGDRNTTEAGWTDNHMVGQSFVAPANVGKITTVRLERFKLGNEAGNLGGVVSVGLYQGDASSAGQCWNRGLGGDECTTVISAGANITKTSKIYIPGNQVQNTLNDLCGLPDNNIVSYLLNKVNVTNPDKPCPKKSEWVRLFTYFQNQGWGDLTGEWVSGGDSCGGCDGWVDPNTLSSDPGDSTIGYADGLAKAAYGAGPAIWTGPNWQAQTSSWQGTDSADNYVNITLDTNAVVPGNTYFVSIQQSHTNTNNDPERDTFNPSTDYYYDEGQYNCENPNEGAPGYITISNYTPAGPHFCYKSNVLVTNTTTGNPYGSGSAFFNTVYYYGGADVTNLKISGLSTAIPTGLVDGSPTGVANVPLTFTASLTSGGADSDLDQSKMYVVKQDQSAASTWGCPAGNIEGSIWCRIKDTGTGLGGQTANIISDPWTPTLDGSYYVAVNAFNENSKKCTGNPWGVGSFDAFCDITAPRSDYMAVIIATPPTASIAGPVTGKIGDNLAYTGTVTDGGGGSGLSKARIFVAETDFSSTAWCTGTVVGSTCRLGSEENVTGASDTIDRTWTPAVGTPNGSYYVWVEADSVDPTLKCTGDPRGPTPPTVDCGASDYLTVNIQTTDCTVTNQLPAAGGCYATFPTLSANAGNGANELQFAVDIDSGFGNPWTCNSGWSASTTYNACAAGTGDYYWGANSQDNPTGSCTTPASPLPNPGISFSIDKTVPSTPAVSTNTYDAVTKLITFNWSVSTDVGCAACSGNATSYWIQGWWSGGDWIVNNGAYTPAACNATTYGPVACDEAHYGQTAYFRALSAKDSLGNESAQQVTTTSRLCPYPSPSVDSLSIGKYGDASTGKRYGASGLRTNDALPTRTTGSSSYNAMQTVQNISGYPASIVLSGLAYVSSTTLPANNTLFELTKSAYLGSGFVAIYANQNKTMSYYKSDGSTGSQAFTVNKYYIYFQGTWRGPYNLKGSYGSQDVGFEIAIDQLAGGAIKPIFNVTLYGLLKSRNWKTYSYLLDIYDTETAPTRVPTPLP